MAPPRRMRARRVGAKEVRMPTSERQTNVDIEQLAKSELVLMFMRRMVREHRKDTGQQALIVDVAEAAADAFDLRHDGDRSIARTLIDVAAEVVAVDLACAR